MNESLEQLLGRLRGATRVATIPGGVAYSIFVDLADVLLVGDVDATETRRKA